MIQETKKGGNFKIPQKLFESISNSKLNCFQLPIDYTTERYVCQKHFVFPSTALLKISLH